ncbi:MAG: AAA family ATPase [Winogradskyella sp.]|uniref:AAA family ATPase n=1 Tax=Winogradskyella sp. TaxID=1883156 RepID=UPI0025EAEFF5|nr:AAA family ATPase [Winogradskyella sp.]NRB58324.1 AAA family ATPase [Winogradskyella sp.]
MEEKKADLSKFLLGRSLDDLKDKNKRAELNREYAEISKKNQEIPTKANEKKFDKPSKEKKAIYSNQHIFTAFDLYHLEIKPTYKLVEPFFQKIGLASLVGSSDTGKSTLLRQLALSVALGKDRFLGFKLNTNSNKVLYVSSEDDPESTQLMIIKQLKSLLEDSELSKLNNLSFIFDTENLLTDITKLLEEKQHDLIIIDTFADIFNKEINSNTQVRQFLNDYHKLAIKHKCLIIFLHHIGKRTERKGPSKNNIIGSQAFEAKMRSVLDLKLSNSTDERYLTILKCNFLPSEYKNKSYVIKFNEHLVFENTNKKVQIGNITKRNNPDIIKAVLRLTYEEKLKNREVEEKLKNTPLAVSKSVVNLILQDHEEKK